MIKCIAIDDEPLALRQMAGYIEKTPSLVLSGAFNSAIEALDFLVDHPVDLMFVDIEMPDLSGMDFVKSLIHPPRVIFTTAYSEYALEGFKVDAADYLLKPISYTDFLKASAKAKDRYFLKEAPEMAEKHSDQFLFVKSEYKIIRINFADIKYIEGMREYVRIHLENHPPVTALMSIRKLEEQLPAANFMRVHRSFLVHLEKIKTVERSRIVFDSKTYVPVGEQYKLKFQKFLDEYFIK